MNVTGIRTLTLMDFGCRLGTESSTAGCEGTVASQTKGRQMDHVEL